MSFSEYLLLDALLWPDLFWSDAYTGGGCPPRSPHTIRPPTVPWSLPAKNKTSIELIRQIDEAEKSIKDAKFDKKTEKEILDNLKKIKNILYI